MELGDILKGAADYLNFLLEFTLAPERSLRDYTAKHRVDTTLMGYLLAGVGVALVIAFVGSIIGVFSPGSFHAFGLSFVHIESLAHIALLQAITLLAIFVLAVIFHCFARLWIAFYARLTRSKPLSTRALRFRPALGGTVQDSLNASLAFSAFFLPRLFRRIHVDASFGRFCSVFPFVFIVSAHGR